MTTTVARWHAETVIMPLQSLLTVTCTGGTGRLVRLGDDPGDAERSSQNLSAGDTVKLGPFTTHTQYKIEAQTGAMTYSSRQVLMQMITQSEYDALSPPDDATLYLIAD